MRRFVLPLMLVLGLAFAGTAHARIGIADAIAVSPPHGHPAADQDTASAAGPDTAGPGQSGTRPTPGRNQPDPAPADSTPTDPAPAESPSSPASEPVPGAPTTSTPAPQPPAASPLFADSFDRPDGLITNDFSHWNPLNGQSTGSPDWEMTSGSLFARAGQAWTGAPDGCDGASPTSSPCTASAVFRLNSVRHDFGDVALSLDVVNDRLVSTARTPAVAFDGIHLWLRYQSEYELYAVSFNRRDGHIVIKKKCAGGSENGGTYYELGRGEAAGFPIPFGVVQHVTATARNLPGGAVELTLARDGATLLSAVDDGVGCAPITAPGAIGVRGDNDEFSFDDLAVAAL